MCFFFFFNDTATTEIYTLSLHDALPIFLELCDELFQRSRAAAGSKYKLWEKLRTIIDIILFKNWEQLLSYWLNVKGHDIIDGYAYLREHAPP